jgi:hypothetical protein
MMKGFLAKRGTVRANGNIRIPTAEGRTDRLLWRP